jgi:hypothetical protein
MTRKNMAVTGIYLLHKSWCNIQKNDLNASCLATSETSSTLSRNRRVESYLTWAAQILFVVRGGEENKYLQFIKKNGFQVETTICIPLALVGSSPTLVMHKGPRMWFAKL